MSLSFSRLAATLVAGATLSLSAHALTPEEVAGTYAVTGVRTEMFQNDTYWKLRTISFSGTVTINADGTLRDNLVFSTNQNESGAAATVFSTTKESNKGKWKIVDDNTVILGGNRFFIGAGNQLMTSSRAEESDHSTVMITLMRQR